MAYATLADLVERAGEAEVRQIADRDRDGVPDPDVIGAALQDASDLIDGYVGARYDIPLASIPPQLRPWAVSIARYTLHRNGAPTWVEQDYKDALAALKDVAHGLIALPVAAGDTPPVAVTGQTMGRHPAQVFTPQKLRGW
ncbi:gp436 family protein [Ruixingdingia sedimenti]|uniref:DUF1320 domain-containing protein n=1 Tax=Ruixingdingia sedimenti TaxID=3073604 RepID=A0ABU1FEY5_9RHOB|nr:DUF1320 domain-containing protein [Xinfangfangia sp. LG-4]MDR5655424.1 DUF1320 domain-containing protein [Xinfangfangia sp. LG-4]